jgi:asparagine synthase (glutamine-hydrolysing)
MSAIAGLIYLDGRPVAPGALDAMLAAMSWRKWDRVGVWNAGGVALAACTLATTQESEEAQPLCDRDTGAVLVFHGRLDNGAELRRELGGDASLESDARLVLGAYKKWDLRATERLRGDFAFVVWDPRRRRAFCARDRVGNKPLIFWRSHEALIFASEAAAVLAAPGVAQRLNEAYLAEQLATEWTSRTETLWQGVERLEPAHTLEFGSSGSRPNRYWFPDLERRLPCVTEDDHAAYYRDLLENITQRMSRSHRPIAFEVSGGLDSSALFAIGVDLERRSKLPAPGLRGYTLGFHGDRFADEHSFSRALSAHLQVPIEEVEPSIRGLSYYRDAAARRLDFPGFPNWTMLDPIYQRATARHSRVVIAGAGGDEWLGSMESHATHALRSLRWREIAGAWESARRGSGSARATWHMLRHGLAPMLPAGMKQGLRNARRAVAGFERPGYCDWLSPRLDSMLEQRREQASRRRYPACSEAQRRQLEILDHPLVLFGRELSERQAAAAGVERRLPFWDHEFVQAAIATRDSMRQRSGLNKWLHRRAMREHLPQILLDRGDKADFFSVFVAGRPELIRHSGEVARHRNEWVNASKVDGILLKGLRDDQVIREDLGLWVLVMADAMTRRVDCA